MFVSGSQDRTIRFWDLRTKGCVHLVTPPPLSGSGPGNNNSLDIFMYFIIFNNKIKPITYSDLTSSLVRNFNPDMLMFK